jgi:hypothetical protein
MSQNAFWTEVVKATPTKCTKAIRVARELLQILVRAGITAVPWLVQAVVQGLLRHYPLAADLDVSIAALPEV